MADAMTVGGALSATKAAFDLMKAFVDVRDASKVQAIKIELMGLLLEAQEAQAALIAEKRDLAERIRELEAWDGQKQRYELVNLAAGVVAFALKPEAKGTELDHQLCANCFEQGHKRYLQFETRNPGRMRVAVCHGCDATLVVTGAQPMNIAGTWGRGSGRDS